MNMLERLNAHYEDDWHMDGDTAVCTVPHPDSFDDRIVRWEVGKDQGYWQITRIVARPTSMKDLLASNQSPKDLDPMLCKQWEIDVESTESPHLIDGVETWDDIGSLSKDPDETYPVLEVTTSQDTIRVEPQERIRHIQDIKVRYNGDQWSYQGTGHSSWRPIQGATRTKGREGAITFNVCEDPDTKPPPSETLRGVQDLIDDLQARQEGLLNDATKRLRSLAMEVDELQAAVDALDPRRPCEHLEGSSPHDHESFAEELEQTARQVEGHEAESMLQAAATRIRTMGDNLQNLRAGYIVDDEHIEQLRDYRDNLSDPEARQLIETTIELLT
jgi:hypothetical protein